MNIASILTKLGRGTARLGRELVDNLLIKAWERVFGPIFGKPEGIPDKIAGMLRSYTAMKLAGLTSSEVDDLYQFAMEELWRRNAVAHDRLVLRHQKIGDGIRGLRSAKARASAKNRAQRRFQIAAVILPVEPKVYKSLDDIQPYVDKCVSRLGWYAMLDDDAWAAWVDVFNYQAEEVEKRVDGLLKGGKNAWKKAKGLPKKAWQATDRRADQLADAIRPSVDAAHDHIHERQARRAQRGPLGRIFRINTTR